MVINDYAVVSEGEKMAVWGSGSGSARYRCQHSGDRHGTCKGGIIRFKFNQLNHLFAGNQFGKPAMKNIGMGNGFSFYFVTGVLLSPVELVIVNCIFSKFTFCTTSINPLCYY